MGKYLIHKTSWLFGTFLFISILVFVMVKLTGIDPCDIQKSTKEVREDCREEKGLNDPFYAQYAKFSRPDKESWQYPGQSVGSILMQGIPNTVKIVTLALLLAFFLGTTIGVVAAIHRNTKTDYSLMALAMIGIAVPELVAGPLLSLIFSMKLGYFPRGGLHEPASYVLPVITLALPITAAIARLARGGMLEVLNQDFVRTARAKGIAERVVIIRHTLRLGLNPVVSYLGPLVAGSFAGGSFVVETIYGIPGIGASFVDASLATPMDQPMIMATTSMFAILILTANFLADVSYAILDPRLRETGNGLTQTSGLSGLAQSAFTILLLVGTVAGFVVAARFTIVAIKPIMVALENSSEYLHHLPVALALIWGEIGVCVLLSYRKAKRSNSPEASPMASAWQRLRKHRMALLSGIVLYFIVLACVLGPWLMEMIFSITFDKGVFADACQAPPFAAWFGHQHVASWIHLLGTDENGRDLLVRTLKGGQVSLSIGTVALLISTIVGVPYGTASAYYGGRIDNVMMRFVDLIYSIPYIILVILLVTFIGKQVSGNARIFLLFVAIGFVSWLTLARITRGQVLSIMKKEYVEAARAIGTPTWQIITRHLIPNAVGPIIVYATRLVAVIILEEAFLSYLGFGIQIPMSSWGILIQEGNKVKEGYWWLLLFPGLCLSVTLFALNYLGDGLRDALDTRLRGAK